MVSTRNAQIELDILRSRVIGVYKIADMLFLVVEYDEKSQSMNTIRITELGAIQQDFGMSMRGQIGLFPDNKSMTDMLNEPFLWAKFIGKFLAD